jgi:hypothetical protein
VIFTSVQEYSPLVAVFLPSGQATRLKFAAETESAREMKVKRGTATIVMGVVGKDTL